MKQVIQPLNGGAVQIEEVPTPSVGDGQVLVRVARSLVSAGTERQAIGFAGKNLLQKAQSRPDLVKQVVRKARRDGIKSTVASVRQRLEKPITLGYSCAGSVVKLGQGVTEFQVGQRVACAGAGYAVHAEMVSVPHNLVVGLPDKVDYESGAFTTLGAIALHGLRLANAQIGETVAVIGLGVVGILTVQLARAAGCRVLGMDPDANRRTTAKSIGCQATAATDAEFKDMISEWTQGFGADRVIIAADTNSSEPVALAGETARDRATVVGVGAIGLDIPRRDYYEKELDFKVSRSYGPGRYDSDYEERGQDYPIGYVRWTENRNMRSFVELVAEGKVDVATLISHRFPIQDAPASYELISNSSGKPFLGVLITYDTAEQTDAGPASNQRIDLQVANRIVPRQDQPPSTLTVGVLGTGNFATSTMLPAMKKTTGITFQTVCAATGPSARNAAVKFGFNSCTTDEGEIFKDPEINAVAIATRHHLHARQVLAGLNAGKHVYCEKPLCLREEELDEIVRTHSEHGDLGLWVGYNRRFARMAVELKGFLATVQVPLVMSYRVNAGSIGLDHWIQDPDQGGGRIVGEVCHFVDFLSFLTGALPTNVRASAAPNGVAYNNDNVILVIDFSDGSVGTIIYASNGDTSMAKERVEVFGGGSSAVLENFRKLDTVREGHTNTSRLRLSQDKGHQAQWQAFRNMVVEEAAPAIKFKELVATTLTTFKALESLRIGGSVNINTDEYIAAVISSNAVDGG
ncbi:bi-domain-containing oxidoreductase [Dehalococcoidia bacterium]|nr:bi-domain-containing oxidoreductase [Dehalococcoidia bacterium]